MASPKQFFQRFPHLFHWFAYGAAVGLFLWICGQFYVPGKGFTYLVMFGGKESGRYIPALRAINHYEQEDSYGYDAQYYAQIAMRPWLSNRALQAAVDSLPYRARRILFSWTAYGLALGDAERALHIYSVQNILCWLILAVVLLRWFPASSWENFFRWFGVLFSFGLCFSVRGSLVDGPSLLLIALGIMLIELKRPWWAAALLGVAGLGKETNLLAAGGLPWPKPTFHAWLIAIVRGLVVVLPLMIWMEVLWLWLGSTGDAGHRNFDWPFTAYFAKWSETLAQWRAEGVGSVAQWSILMLVSMSVQWLFFVLWPRWREPWWRVGVAYSLLMAVLGNAVWEGYPGAASRVLLPMTLAFNILVPRGRQPLWWLVLLLGNLTVIFSSDTLKPPGRESYRVSGPSELIAAAENGHRVEARFNDAEWYLPERSRLEYWRWSRGSASITFHNPQIFPVVAEISFDLKSNDERIVTVRSAGIVLWSGSTGRSLQEAKIRKIRLEPGANIWTFDSDQPAESPPNGDPRKMAFSLRNLNIAVEERAGSPAP
ncbi:MAG: glycosyltransferase family 87 protein [Opitutaceae bacterium]